VSYDNERRGYAGGDAITKSLVELARLQHEMPKLRAVLATVTAERDAWRVARGPFGPQTPAEVAIFEQEAKRVEAETRAHEIALAVAAERAAHAETRKALQARDKSLEKMEQACAVGMVVYDQQTETLEATRDELRRELRNAKRWIADLQDQVTRLQNTLRTNT